MDLKFLNRLYFVTEDLLRVSQDHDSGFQGFNDETVRAVFPIKKNQVHRHDVTALGIFLVAILPQPHLLTVLDK